MSRRIVPALILFAVLTAPVSAAPLPITSGEVQVLFPSSAFVNVVTLEGPDFVVARGFGEFGGPSGSSQVLRPGHFFGISIATSGIPPNSSILFGVPLTGRLSPNPGYFTMNLGAAVGVVPAAQPDGTIVVFPRVPLSVRGTLGSFNPILEASLEGVAVGDVQIIAREGEWAFTGNSIFTVEAPAVPEPGTLATVAAGLLALTTRIRRSRKTSVRILREPPTCS